MQTITETWNGMTNYQTPQEFMDLSRQQGHTSIEEAVDAYVAGIPAMSQDWAEFTADELESIRSDLRHYLEATQGEEWDVPQEPSAAEVIGQLWDAD